MLKRTMTIAAICLAARLLAPLPAFAQTTQTLTIYGAGLRIDGTAGVGDRTTDISVDIEEFIESLEMGGLASYRVETPKWSFAAEGAFFGLGQSNGGASMDVDMTIAQLTAAYRFNQSFDAYVGVRYTDLSAEIAATGPVSGEPLTAKNGDEFLDPIVGARLVAPLGEKWTIQAQGDIGGFGVDMEFEWQATLDVGFRPSETVTVWLGYRVLDQDFEDAGEGGRFDMDATYQGPQLGVAFRF